MVLGCKVVRKYTFDAETAVLSIRSCRQVILYDVIDGIAPFSSTHEKPTLCEDSQLKLASSHGKLSVSLPVQWQTRPAKVSSLQTQKQLWIWPSSSPSPPTLSSLAPSICYRLYSIHHAGIVAYRIGALERIVGLSYNLSKFTKVSE